MTEQNTSTYKNIFFVGIGGIGMSAIARFYNTKGKKVAGYDRVETPLTRTLEQEGIFIVYQDKLNLIPEEFRNPKDTLVIYTPAIPDNHQQLNYFKNGEFKLIKRAKALGEISKSYYTVGISGTHGKTTISTMSTHLLNSSKQKANGFLGGISKNYNSNLLLSKDSKIVVMEADEFDRSFLNLYPDMALISSMDADHLDIYEKKESLHQSFFEYINQIKTGGTLIQKYGLPFNNRQDIKRKTYSLNNSESDFYARNIVLKNGLYHFDLQTPQELIEELKLGVPGKVNLENAIGASAIALGNGIEISELRNALESYSGVKRRFDYRVLSESLIYIDDYAHHPEELKAFISSVRDIYPQKMICGIFQPHLYSRTQDFAPEFAQALSALDELILLDIYPARELPIEGVSSEIIFNQVKLDKKTLCTKEDIINLLKNKKVEVLLTLGAGDIDTLVEPIEHLLKR